MAKLLLLLRTPPNPKACPTGLAYIFFTQKQDAIGYLFAESARRYMRVNTKYPPPLCKLQALHCSTLGMKIDAGPPPPHGEAAYPTGA
ncbi:hypothetical protein WISP_59244 [Willisornis vidua]|uniref:Uncharacterized protein n=1 Tax=Willisornis vidua TaxID=1566151 RepID=A0ABQ9DBP9_9PASS|nr:hypothetical protein WISP_59244 [Willisornis vidua]